MDEKLSLKLHEEFIESSIWVSRIRDTMNIFYDLKESKIEKNEFFLEIDKADLKNNIKKIHDLSVDLISVFIEYNIYTAQNLLIFRQEATEEMENV